MKPVLSAIVCCLLFIVPGFAQDTTVYYRKDGSSYKRSDYIDNMTAFIEVTPFIQRVQNHFEVRDKRALTFEPNQDAAIGLRLHHRWLGISLSYGPRNLQENLKGRTDFLNLQLNGYGRKLVFDVAYMKYSGYYLENYKKFPELESVYGKIYPQRPDITTVSIGANMYYIFNDKKFSYRSSFIQNEVQKKSAGSFMINGSVLYFGISGDSTIVPPEIRSFYDPKAQLKSGEFFSVSLLPGYTHTFVLKQRFYATMGAFLGGMTQFQTYKTENTEVIDRVVFLPRVIGKFGIGYNGQRFYTGFTGTVDTYNMSLDNKTTLVYVMAASSFFVGMRIAVPPSLQKYSDKFNQLNPLLLINAAH